MEVDSIRAFEHAGWERAANSYEAAFATATSQFIPALLDAADVRRDRAVLDVACGPGLVAAAAVERGAQARGLDFSAAMLCVARARHPDIPFDQGDAESLPYPDRGFDAVVSNFGIHHVPRPILALEQAHRVLRPGGSLAFSIWAAPGENIAWKLVFDAIARVGDLSASHAPAPGGGFGTQADCATALERAGFGSIGVRKMSGIWRQPDGRALLGALRSGTARMAALIESQPAEAIPAIIADIDRGGVAYRDSGGLAIPLAALVAHGVKP
jgi:SAM-dependent methyltransferase